MQYLDGVSKMTELSQIVSGANHSTTQSIPQLKMLKKLKLYGSMKTYKTF